MADDVLDTHARIECAAFEAAYLEMNPPNPASRHFAELVTRYRERLWAEHLVRPAAPPASQSDEPGG